MEKNAANPFADVASNSNFACIRAHLPGFCRHLFGAHLFRSCRLVSIARWVAPMMDKKNVRPDTKRRYMTSRLGRRICHHVCGAGQYLVLFSLYRGSR